MGPAAVDWVRNTVFVSLVSLLVAKSAAAQQPPKNTSLERQMPADSCAASGDGT